MSSESWHPMNIQQLRQSLKIKWLTYYKTNRRWLVRMQVWGTFNGRRRPYSGFILATITALEPKLHHILPFILDLNNNPDDIVAALGLNFNPEEQLHLVKIDNSTKSTSVKPIENQRIPEPPDKSKALPPVRTPVVDSFKQQSDKLPARVRSEGDRTIDVKATTQSDKLPEQGRSQSDRTIDMRATTQSDKPPEHDPSKRARTTDLKTAQSDKFPEHGRGVRESFSQQPLPNLQTNLQKLPADTHKSVSITPRVEIEDTRNKVVQKEIPLNQSVKTEVRASNTSHKQEKSTTTSDSQQDRNKQSEQQSARVNKLAKWIDELCQGSGWDRDDMIFIRF